MSKKYIIENKIFKETYDKINDIFMSLSVIKEFCENNKDTYELRLITPIINFIYDNSDKLYQYFINKRYAKKGEKITFNM